MDSRNTNIIPKTFQKRKSRYYKTSYNESLKVKDLFIKRITFKFINLLYKSCEDYCNTHSESQSNGFKCELGGFVLSLDIDFDVAKINGKYLADYYSNFTGNKLYLIPFIKALIISTLTLNDEYEWSDELLIVSKLVLPYWDSINNIKYNVINFLDGTKDPLRYRLFFTNSIQTGNPILTSICFDTYDRYIQDLLLDYLKTQHDVQPRAYHIEFYERFAESLEFDTPTDIYGFNSETLLKQEKFFLSIRREAELENRLFYRYILNRQGDKKSITIEDGVSIGYLMSESFANAYINGYRYVPINPNEDYPGFDKWAVTANGLDLKTAADKPEQIKLIDFTRIKDSTIKNATKAWYWGEAKAGFENRYRNIIYIMDFFEYRDNLRKMFFDKFIQARANSDLDIKNTVLSEEIISYTSEWDNKVTNETYRSRISPLKLFLQYMNENEIYKTEIAAFEYLGYSNKGTKSKQEVLPIAKDDFKKLINIMEKKASYNDLHMLYYIVFCMNSLTPLRISSILDLGYDSVVEKSKGVYAVEVKVKTSNGDEKSIQISIEVKRLIDVAISLTSEARKSAPNDLKHFLFLVNNQKGIYKSIPHRSYGSYLHNCCKKIGIPLYSPQHLRKTYYTNLVENAVKKNVSLKSLKELTGHSNIDTTENHYVKENIRNYLEATMGVEIGNLPIAGSIVSDYPVANREDVVNDGCGYCKNPECNVLGSANCLMCRGFVTTPGNIGQFEEAITVLSKQITTNENLHDKEHLYAVKRLYAAYLEQLYIKKEEIDVAPFN